MDIQKVFSELGRMHLEITQLREQLAEAQAQLAVYTESKKAQVPQGVKEG